MKNFFLLAFLQRGKKDQTAKALLHKYWEPSSDFPTIVTYLPGGPNNNSYILRFLQNQYYTGPSFQDRLMLDVTEGWDIRIGNSEEKDTEDIRDKK